MQKNVLGWGGEGGGEGQSRAQQLCLGGSVLRPSPMCACTLRTPAQFYNLTVKVWLVGGGKGVLGTWGREKMSLIGSRLVPVPVTHHARALRLSVLYIV